MSDTKVIRPNVIPAAILTLTQSDANEMASRCPYEVVDGAENVLYVYPTALNVDMINNRKAILFCSHYVKEKDGESKVKGEWKIEAPITQTVHKNIFSVDLCPVDTNIIDFKK